MTMGFSGHATQVLKSNRVLLKKSRSFRELRKDYLDYSQETKLHFKELTDVERKMVRDKIRAQAKKDRYLYTLFSYSLRSLLRYL